MFPTAPMNLETQHYVMCPDWDGTMKATAIYAMSPEAAVEQTRALFKDNPKFQGADIRLATGEELPWNDPTAETYVVTTESPARFVVTSGDEKTVRETYNFLFQGAPYELRPATAEEKEMMIRLNQVDSDKRDEEDFNYGFNVLYYEMRDEGIL